MTPFQTVLIQGCWRIGSTALNLSLIQHPAIFGAAEEMRFFQEIVRPWVEQMSEEAPERIAELVAERFVEFCAAKGRRDQPWVVHKDPQDSRIIDRVVEWCRPARVILLLRNPYAIGRSLQEQDYPLAWAYSHMREFYAPLLALERERPALFYRVRYEDLAREPRRVLADLLAQVFHLPMCESCLTWEKTKVRWRFGDPKVSDTQSWEASRVSAWREELSVEEKEYVRANAADLFAAFGYDPDDVGAGE